MISLTVPTVPSPREGVDETLDVVVVGGGISGLTTAFGAHMGNPTARIALLEAAPTIGGKIQSTTFAGRVVDRGPEGFLAKSSTIPDLCSQLGIESELVSPGGSAPGIVVNGQLRSLPAGILGSIPTHPWATVRSGLLPWSYLINATLDRWRPSSALTHDVSIGEIVRRRLGRPVVENIVQPLLGGITAGDVNHTSVEQCAPALAAALATRQGLIEGMRLGGKPASGSFMSFRDGMQTLFKALARTLPAGSVRTDTAITKLEPYSDGWILTANNRRIFTSRLFMCTPPHAAARLLATIAPEVTTLLAPLTGATVAIITLAFPRHAFGQDPVSTGFVVAPKEGHLLTACTWITTKWPHLHHDDLVIARCSVGRANDARCEELNDSELERIVEDELRSLTGATAPSLERATVRWTRAMPTFLPRHGERIQRARALLPQGISLLGEAYDGVGIHQCVESAMTATHMLSSQTTVVVS